MIKTMIKNQYQKPEKKKTEKPENQWWGCICDSGASVIFLLLVILHSGSIILRTKEGRKKERT